MSETGKVVGLAHIGMGDDNTYELIDFYCNKLGVENQASQDIKHVYISRINGVPCEHFIIGFVRIENDDTRLEFVGCTDTVVGSAVFPFGVGGHMHLTYLTDNIRAFLKKCRANGVTIETEIAAIDYGRYKGRESFFLRDPNGLYVQIVDDGSGEGKGRLIHFAGTTYTVTDIDVAERNFEKALDRRVSRVDIAGSAYLRGLGGDAPLSAREVAMDEPNAFYIELLEAAKPNPESAKVWVNSLACLHIGVMVTGIHDLHARMSDMGIKFVGKPSPVEIGINQGATAIFAKISNEILVELFQGKPTSV